MHTHEDTMKILGCSKMTLSRYVKSGKLNKVKKGRKTFYDEVEVALLVEEIEDNKKRVGIEIKPKEKIELPPSVEDELQDLSANTSLNKIGMETLSVATKDLIDLGLFEECDKQILLSYALSVQAYNHYFVKSMEIDGVTVADTGSYSVHPYHRIMMDHQKQMLNYSDRLGLNPLARQKLEPKEKKEKSSIMDILDAK